MSTTGTTPQAKLSPLRSALWPIYSYELKKFLPSLIYLIAYIDKAMATPCLENPIAITIIRYGDATTRASQGLGRIKTNLYRLIIWIIKKSNEFIKSYYSNLLQERKNFVLNYFFCKLTCMFINNFTFIIC